MSMVPVAARSAYAGLLIRAMTLLAPILLASMADRILASSALVTATKTSVRSIFSSSNRFSSVASPCSTMALSSRSEIRRARS